MAFLVRLDGEIAKKRLQMRTIEIVQHQINASRHKSPTRMQIVRVALRIAPTSAILSIFSSKRLLPANKYSWEREQVIAENEAHFEQCALFKKGVDISENFSKHHLVTVIE